MRFASFFLILTTVLFSGCTLFGRTHYVEAKRPVLPEVEKPTLRPFVPEEQFLSGGEVSDVEGLRRAYDVAIENFIAIANREAALDAVVAEYNRRAKAHNEANGFTLSE